MTPTSGDSIDLVTLVNELFEIQPENCQDSTKLTVIDFTPMMRFKMWMYNRWLWRVSVRTWFVLTGDCRHYCDDDGYGGFIPEDSCPVHDR